MTTVQRWVLVASGLASFMVVLDALVVATALTTIHRELGASMADLEWTVNAYLLTFAVLMMAAATLGDRLGRRRVFVAGLIVFAGASAACALAGSVGVLVAARTVQGAGAAMIMPMALALLNAAFPPERRGWATGIFGAITGFAAVAGPLIGGAVTQGLSWQWIFWVNVPIGLVTAILASRRVAETPRLRGRIDVVGVLAAGVAALGLVWALVRANEAGWTSPETLSALAIGLVAVAGLVGWERRVSNPMLPLRLFRARPFAAGNVAIFFLNATLMGAIFLTAQYFQVVGGDGALMAGAKLLPWGIVPFALAPWTGRLADAIGERVLVVAGTLGQAAGMGWLALVAGASYPALIAPMAVGGAGLTLAVPAVTRAVVSRVALADLGRASATYSTIRQFGGAFGVAIVGAVFAARGSYSAFTDGYRPAIAVAAGLAMLGAAAAVVLPGNRAAAPVTAPAGAVPVTAPAAARVS
jgi:EmrB/QacA subfamily drug resistance transporter